MSIQVVFNNLPQTAAALGTNGNEVVRATAAAVADTARSTVPVDTGSLRDSIAVEQVANEHYQVVAGIRYAGFVEFGTAHNGPAQPYMTPAAHQHEQDLADRMARIVGG